MSDSVPSMTRLTEIVLSACSDHNQIAGPGRQVDLSQKECARLYGKDGVLDSLGLVSLLVSVEQAVEDEYGVQIVIADERAFSQTRSPFRSVGALAEYIQQIL